MIKYHGLPITPNDAAIATVKNRHAFVSWAHPTQLPIAVEYSDGFAIDNGAFSLWRSNKIVVWETYYKFVEKLLKPKISNFQWVIIPDVIDGDLKSNQNLINEWPFGQIGSPVWHLHEPIEWLIELTQQYYRVCLGSSGEYAVIGTPQWWNRMDTIFRDLKENSGNALLHGLRMMHPKIIARYPFASVDSTNIGQNIGIDARWNDRSYPCASKTLRALVLRDRIESMPTAKKFNNTEQIRLTFTGGKLNADSNQKMHL